jgi:hypothetical protein
MSLVEALSADRAGEIQSAAAQYEEVLAAGDSSLRVLLNLALLYWQATDVGLAAETKLGPEFLATASRRFPQLLEEARRRFPESTEARFWKQYIAWADLGEDLDSDYCRQLLREDPATLIPAMHLFATSQGNEAQAEVHELLGQCRDDGTTRARYIASVLEGVMKRTSPRR